MALALVTPSRFTVTLSEKEAAHQAHLFTALVEPMRLRILNLLSRYEWQMCGLDIEESLGLTQANLSHHLGILREAGIIERRKVKHRIYYSVCKETLVQVQWILQEMIDPFHTLKQKGKE